MNDSFNFYNDPRTREYPEPEFSIEIDGNLWLLPFVKAVCPLCRGNGTHINPAIDCNGLTSEDFAGDPDFTEAYMSGGYDVQCAQCKGLRVVDVVDEENAPPEALKAWLEEQAENRAFEDQCRAELRNGA